jgi:hypothetical protein
MHVKFCEMQNGDEPNIRFEEVVKVLVEADYSGWISSEHEGSPGETFQLVRQQQAMVRRYAESYSSSTASTGARTQELGPLPRESNVTCLRRQYDRGLMTFRSPRLRYDSCIVPVLSGV